MRMSKEALCRALTDAGCDEALRRRLVECEEQPAEQLRLLTIYRRSLLNALHVAQSRLDCVDYIVYQLKGTAECECRRRVRHKEEETLP